MIHVSSPVPVPGAQLVFVSFTRHPRTPLTLLAFTTNPFGLSRPSSPISPTPPGPRGSIHLHDPKYSGSHCRLRTGTVPMGRCPRARVARDTPSGKTQREMQKWGKRCQKTGARYESVSEAEGDKTVCWSDICTIQIRMCVRTFDCSESQTLEARHDPQCHNPPGTWAFLDISVPRQQIKVPLHSWASPCARMDER